MIEPLGVAPGATSLVVVDPAVESLVEELLEQLAPRAVIHRYSGTDKSTGTAESIWQAMVAHRPGVVIGVGGGALGDMVGFCAATYRRGIPFVSVPTTLLSMIDASIGGKTAIDVGGLRNAVGVVRLPTLVVGITELIPMRGDCPRIGLSEAVKIGMLYDADLIDRLEGHLTERTPSFFDIVVDSAVLKARLCAAGRGETGLLYGHNLSYALESTLGWDHATAVGHGINLEAAIAVQASVLGEDALRRQQAILTSLGLRDLLDHLPVDDVCNRMRPYKLNSGAQAGFVVPRCVGERSEAAESDRLWVDWEALPGLLKSSAALLGC